VSQPLFVVGQNVRYRHKLSGGAEKTYTVAKVLPLEGRGFEYRIKGSEDAFMRVAKEHELAEPTFELALFR